MPEYESSTYHLSPADRWTAICGFIFFMVPTVGSYMTFGGDIWLSRLLTYVVGALFLVVILGFIDARRQAAERRQRRKARRFGEVGDQNWFWSSDCDPGGSGGAA